MVEQKTYTFDNLQVVQTIIDCGKDRTKHNDVSRFDGECWELLPESDPDHKKAIILMHNANTEA